MDDENMNPAGSDKLMERRRALRRAFHTEYIPLLELLAVFSQRHQLRVVSMCFSFYTNISILIYTGLSELSELSGLFAWLI